MNERRQDFELLQRFMRHGEQSAFTDVVRRHLDLVFATALRKVEDPGAAQEVAQNVFTVLARKAWRFAPDDSLPAWLHKAALLESKSWLRGELRRRRREETAAELGTTMKNPADQPAFHALVPLLDEALLSLREKDRTALLLRFYESHSLRDVGTAFGVSEDTAQKRVQSALEKLSEFFKRRGFKTATVAGTAAALEYTVTSTSSAMVSTVVTAALQVAPPALVGLGAWLARLVSLSRGQTAAVCVVLAAAPVGWQLNERHVAGEEAKRTQTQLLAAHNEGASMETELERLRSTSGTLEQSVAQANEAAARAAESAQAFEAWKQNVRARLIAADYRWPDDSPFVRIPKAVVTNLIENTDSDLYSLPGGVPRFASELLGMTPSERQSLDETLHRSFLEHLEQLEASAAGIQETNLPVKGRVVASRAFILPAPGKETGPRRETGPRTDVLAEMRGVLGEERWSLVQVSFHRKPGGMTYSSGAGMPKGLVRELLVSVQTDAKGTLNVQAEFEEVVGHANATLSMFLPEGDPKRTNGADEFLSDLVRAGMLSNALRQRAVAWLQEQAIARLGRKEQP
jgi:RNA polymerase sigma factor (sigma-70 family)